MQKKNKKTEKSMKRKKNLAGLPTDQIFLRVDIFKIYNFRFVSDFHHN